MARQEPQAQPHGGQGRGIDRQGRHGGGQRLGAGRRGHRRDVRPTRQDIGGDARDRRHDQEQRRPLGNPPQQVAPTIQHEAQAEGEAEPDQGRGVRDHARIRRRHGEEGDPFRVQPQGQGQRRGQPDGRPGSDQEAGDPVHDRPRPTLAIHPSEDRAKDQHGGIEQGQHPQEPQMGQREIGPVIDRRRRRRRARRDQTVGMSVPDQGRDDPRHDRKPEGRQRPDYPHRPLPCEPGPSPSRQHHMGEQAGDQEEGRHAKQVNGEEQPRRADGPALVRHDPDLLREERQAGVQHDAKQQRTRPQRIEPVQPLGLIPSRHRHDAPSSD